MSNEPLNTTPAQPKTEIMAILSLIFSIVSFVCCLTILASIPAVILGHLAKKKIGESGGTLTGSGLALAGMIVGYVNIGFFVLGVIGNIVTMATGGSSMFDNLNF